MRQDGKLFFLQGGLRGRLGQGQKGETGGRRKGKMGRGKREEGKGGKGGVEGELWEWDGGVFLVKVGQGE